MLPVQSHLKGVLMQEVHLPPGLPLNQTIRHVNAMQKIQRSVHGRSPSGDKSAQYEELLDKHKQANDELLKGANVSDLYNKENTTATSAANTKAGGDPKLGGEGASAPHDK